MKKVLLLLAVAAFTVALVSLAVSAPTYNVKGTKHNLSSSQTTTWRSTNEDQICVFCHTPHNGLISNDLPLWNKSITSAAGNYGVYSSSTLNATPTAISRTGPPWTRTSLCMSCHDGTMAVNTLVNPSNDLGANPTMAGPISITSNANLGTDLSNDHPVNFIYNSALATADGGLVDPSNGGTNNPNGSFITEYPGKTLSQVMVPGGNFSCASCHEPHIYYGGAYTAYAPFLIAPNTASGLCLSCHLK